MTFKRHFFIMNLIPYKIIDILMIQWSFQKDYDFLVFKINIQSRLFNPYPLKSQHFLVRIRLI
jgi:hypothetical protein